MDKCLQNSEGHSELYIQKLQKDLNEIDALKVKILKILLYSIVDMKDNMLQEFKNLVRLDLRYNFLRSLNSCAFESLHILETINLSNNLIEVFDDNLFEMNLNLKRIILRKNLLISFSSNLISKLSNLKVLDLSYNMITKVSAYGMNCPQLNKLYLRFNQIETFDSTEFCVASNLTYLDLSYNNISHLSSNAFSNLVKIKCLNLSNNIIEEMDPSLLNKLRDLSKLLLYNNLLTTLWHRTLLLNKYSLFHLDLTANKIRYIEDFIFNGCPNLRILNLTVYGKFQASSLKRLVSLTSFGLFYKCDERFSLDENFWINFLDKICLMKLKLVFQKVHVIKYVKFSHLKNLEHLHIECIEANHSAYKIHFDKQFNRMQKLTKLILKNLNSLMVLECNLQKVCKTENLIYFDLTGVKNVALYRFQNFAVLEYLNLSFSEIRYINEFTFKYLVNLKYLYLEYLKLKSISAKLFAFNSKLIILSCANCRISTIDDFSFIKLSNLEILDLRNNCLIGVTQDTFYGLDKTQIFLCFNPIKNYRYYRKPHLPNYFLIHTDNFTECCHLPIDPLKSNRTLLEPIKE